MGYKLGCVVTLPRGQECILQKPAYTIVDIRRLIIFGTLFAAGVYVVIRFFAAVAGLVLLFSIVALLTLIVSPVVTWLEERKVPRYLGTVTLALLALGLLALAAWYIYPILRQQFLELFESLPGYLDDIERWLADHLGFLGFKHRVAGRTTGSIIERAGIPLARIGLYTVSAIEVLASIGILFISTIYALAQPRTILLHFLQLIGPKANLAAEILLRLSTQLRRWAYSVAAGMLAVGLLTWIALHLVLRMPYALPFAVIAALLEIVPIVGPAVAGVPPALVALAIDPKLFFWVVVAIIIIQQIENHVIVPLIIGHGVSLHPVSIMFAVTVLGALFGIAGIFLSVPAAITVKILIDELYLKPGDAGSVHVREKVEWIVSGRTGRPPPEDD